MSHTPGPWITVYARVRWHSDRKPLFDKGLWHILPQAYPEQLPICEVDHADDNDPTIREIAEANARLIGTAPELLEHLKVRRKECCAVGACGRCQDDDALIAKAEGRE